MWVHKSEGEKQARRIWIPCPTADAEQLHMYWATVARTHVSLPCNHMHVTARTYGRISYYRVFLDRHVAVRVIIPIKLRPRLLWRRLPSSSPDQGQYIRVPFICEADQSFYLYTLSYLILNVVNHQHNHHHAAEVSGATYFPLPISVV